MPELSIILPFVNEWPQLIWTIRNIAEELRDRVDFELIAINNYPKDGIKKNTEDKGGKHLEVIERGQKWLKVLKYDKKLSHWNAKRVGILNSSGKFLFFCDAHCSIGRDALYKAFEFYKQNYEDIGGSLHLPLTYQILEWRKLIYKLEVDAKIGKVHYSFSSYRNEEFPYEVPCMSTCGMLISREIYDDLGGWPKMLGIYGGGENFLNFVSATLGYKKWIMPGEPVYHHGDKRGYSYNYGDFIRNRMVANYLFGGEIWLNLLAKNAGGHPEILNKFRNLVLKNCRDQRNMLKKKTKISIEGWLEQWLKK